MKYTLSIVIPTKNRQEYCIKTVEQIRSLNLLNTEIIIQDNSDDNKLKDYLDNRTDIKYNYHKGIISFVDNFSEAISFCTGEYVCMIGDDDGILPNIIDVIKYAKKNEYDAIIPGLNSVYVWPSKKSFIKNGENGYLCLTYIKNRMYEANIKKALKSLLSQGGQGYQQLELPRLYHGVVKKDILDKIKAESGIYFGGLTPDIYMSVALSFYCKKALCLEYPVTISGICNKSGSSDSATGKHTGKLEEAPHFRGHINYKWDGRILPIYSVETIWAETVLYALKKLNHQDLINEFGYEYLTTLCLYKYPQYKKDIINYSKKMNISYSTICLKSKLIPYISLCKKIIKRVLRKRKDVLKFYNVQNIIDAYEITNRILNENNK